jgi:cytochrome c-type biogenesis protein CcmH/NrfF
MVRSMAIVAVLLTALAARAEPAPLVEQRLMQNLACMCDTCNREPIDHCKCPLAAQMRDEVKAALRGREVATVAGQSAAYDAVRSSFAKKYGEGVLVPRPVPKTDPRMAWLPGIIFLGGLAWLVLITRRSLARRRRARREPG